ncbi:MAG: hypothetical protein IH886_16555 [Nitrospinae bacterium]|nr:hypothetical protein [Nitrospinota bacterium]
MRTLPTLTAAAALLAAFGFAGTAMADPNADAVESFTTVTGSVGDGTEATDGVNGNATSLGFDGANGGALILRFTDNTCLTVAASNDVTVTEISSISDDYTIAVGLIGQNLITDGNGTGTTSFDVSTEAPFAFTRISLLATNDADGDNSGAEIDDVTCLNNLAFGTDHINKAITAGGSSIVINSKNGADAEQSFSFEIVITNPDGADLSNFNFHDTVPGEFDILAVTPDNTASTTNPGCTNVAFAEHKPGNKLSPDKITWDVDLAIGESCTLDVDVVTARKNNSPKKVNFAPTECPAGGVVLNEGVEVHDVNDELILIDDTSLVLTCVDPPADPD